MNFHGAFVFHFNQVWNLVYKQYHDLVTPPKRPLCGLKTLRGADDVVPIWKFPFMKLNLQSSVSIPSLY